MHVMMAVSFTIGGHVNQLRPRTSLGKSPAQALDELLAVGEQAFEGEAAGNGAVVKEEADTAAARQLLEVRSRRVHLTAMHFKPVFLAARPYARGLMRCQNREAKALLCQHIQRFEVHGGFG